MTTDSLSPHDVASSRALNVVSVLALVVSAAWACGNVLPSNRRDIHVAPHGRAFASGAHDDPLSSIQAALDRANPGATIHVAPGRYIERLHWVRGGRPHAPVVLQSKEPGTAVVSWSESLTLRDWRDEGDGIFSAPAPHPIYRLRRGDLTLFRCVWGGVDAFRKLARRPERRDGFLHEAGRLYVALATRESPANVSLVANRPSPPPREWGEFRSANLWVETDHVEIRGLQFECGIGAGVFLWNASHVAIRDCEFIECNHGVNGRDGLRPAHHVEIDHCRYDNAPQSDWRRGWLSWAELYAHHSSSSLAALNGRGNRVTNCWIAHAGDGLQCTSPSADDGLETLLEGNYFEQCTDDAVEFDGPAANIIVSQNLFWDCEQNFGLSPVLEGPVRIEGNWCLHPTGGLNGSQLKLKDSQRPGRVIRNVDVARNAFHGRSLCYWDETPLSNVLVRENRFLVSTDCFDRRPPEVFIDNEFLDAPASPAVDQRSVLGALGVGRVESDHAEWTAAWNRWMRTHRPGPRWSDRWIASGWPELVDDSPVTDPAADDSR